MPTLSDPIRLGSSRYLILSEDLMAPIYLRISSSNCVGLGSLF